MYVHTDKRAEPFYNNSFQVFLIFQSSLMEEGLVELTRLTQNQ